MGRSIQPDDLAARLADVERLVEALVRGTRVPNVTTIASGMQANSVSTSQTTSSSVYTDLTTPGPSVTIQVPPTHRLLIISSAEVQFSTHNSGAPGDGGAVGYTVTGTLNGTLGPKDLLRMGIQSVPVVNPIDVGTSFLAIETSLIVETVTVTMKYLAMSGAAAPATFLNRVLAVLPL